MSGILGFNSKPAKPLGANDSPLMHLVSTLGHGSTPDSGVFNICLIIGAVTLGILLVGLGLRVEDEAIRWVVLAGAVLAVVGGNHGRGLSSDKPTESSPHDLVSAFGFFLLSAGVVASITSNVLLAPSPSFPWDSPIPASWSPSLRRRC